MAMAFRGFGKKSPTGFDVLPLPGVIGGFGGGTWNADGTQATPVQTAQETAQPEAPARWLDGGKFGVRDGIGLALGAIGDALTQRPVATSMVTNAFQQQREQKLAQQQRQQSLADKLWMAQWERDNPKPVNNDTINDFNWYKGLSDADRKIYHQMKPEYRQGPDGRFYRIDVADDAAPNANDLGATLGDGWEIEGGGGSDVTGGF